MKNCYCKEEIKNEIIDFFELNGYSYSQKNIEEILDLCIEFKNEHNFNFLTDDDIMDLIITYALNRLLGND